MLRAAEITEVPEPLGFDDLGREVLAFLPGAVGNYPLPDWLWSSTILHEAGTLLRRMHDASVPLAHLPEHWRVPAHEPVEVVCLNDVAPYNMVFNDGHLTGVIDFDMASPGPRILAELALFTDQRAAETGRGDFVEHAALYRRDREIPLAMSG
jgi:hypothetical protein